MAEQSKRLTRGVFLAAVMSVLFNTPAWPAEKLMISHPPEWETFIVHFAPADGTLQTKILVAFHSLAASLEISHVDRELLHLRVPPDGLLSKDSNWVYFVASNDPMG